MIRVGIDLGTTTSAVAIVKDGIPVMIQTDGAHVLTPSIVRYESDHAIVGREALLIHNFKNTAFSAKRFMADKQKILSKNAIEISADILTYLKKSAESNLSDQIDAAVITVPAHFSDLQRMATKQAASLAGIKILRLINEPTAAALAFGLDKKINGIFCVYDFGGGTFDFSILRLENGIFQVLSTGGDNYLGGDDVDHKIVQHNLAKHNLDSSYFSEDEKISAKLIAKHLKENLKPCESSFGNFVYQNKDYVFELSDAMLKKLSYELLQKTLDISDDVFNCAHISNESIDGIILVGGMTKLDVVKNTVRNHFNVTILDNINPEEAVALGAAIHAENISNKNSNTLLIDVAPLSLGVETFGGGVDKIIYRNTPIPITESREYTTYQNNQTGIKFRIVQGERLIANECRTLADFELKNIPPMPAGIARVIVEFSIDVNGLLSVKSHETHTGVSQSIVVEPSSGLTEEDMIEMLTKAAQNKTDDQIKDRHINIQVETERIIKFWESIIEKIPKDYQKIAQDRLILLKEKLELHDYDDVINLRKEIDDIFGQFLDDIINSQLSGKDILNIEENI